MAFENLFIRTPKTLGGVRLDAVISESHTNSIKTTSNPIELGADITDHAIIEPKQIVINAVVSDTPLGTAAFGQIVDLVTGLFGTATAQNITRSGAAYNTLVQLMEAREPIDVQTKLKLYTNMLIKTISTTQDKDSSRIVDMSIALKEVLIVESQIVKLDPAQLQAGTTTEQASSPENRGRVEPVTPDETTEKSVLKSVIDWVGG